ncbi:unnamed protein product [Linum tenue]|uniref:HAT C-terminal dimerisation domain-containing protein n=1 Tax=Linum tenue TaxID=586396 RepID=A0AAV0KGZ2_9ROSI|nr:unnamed protein product [Linum tenue]
MLWEMMMVVVLEMRLILQQCRRLRFEQVFNESDKELLRHGRHLLLSLGISLQIIYQEHSAKTVPSFMWLVKEFDSFGENQFLGDRTQLDEYLDDKRLKRKQPLDVLLWWKNNESRFPELAHLARDILSIPITTVASESAFSMGGDDRDNGLEVKISKAIGTSSMAANYTPISDE